MVASALPHRPPPAVAYGRAGTTRYGIPQSLIIVGWRTVFDNHSKPHIDSPKEIRPTARSCRFASVHRWAVRLHRSLAVHRQRGLPAAEQAAEDLERALVPAALDTFAQHGPDRRCLLARQVGLDWIPREQGGLVRVLFRLAADAEPHPQLAHLQLGDEAFRIEPHAFAELLDGLLNVEVHAKSHAVQHAHLRHLRMRLHGVPKVLDQRDPLVRLEGVRVCEHPRQQRAGAFGNRNQRSLAGRFDRRRLLDVLLTLCFHEVLPGRSIRRMRRSGWQVALPPRSFVQAALANTVSGRKTNSGYPSCPISGMSRPFSSLSAETRCPMVYSSTMLTAKLSVKTTPSSVEMPTSCAASWPASP